MHQTIELQYTKLIKLKLISEITNWNEQSLYNLYLYNN